MANELKETHIVGNLFVDEKIYKYIHNLGRYVELGEDVLPATKSTLGSIIVGNNLTIDSKGVLSARSYIPATDESPGLMSAEDKYKLDRIDDNANNYILPKAIPATDEDPGKLGGIIIGKNINYDNETGTAFLNVGSKYVRGVLAVGDNIDVSDKGFISVPLAEWSPEKKINGLITSEDKHTIDSLSTVATTGSYNDLIDKPAQIGVYRFMGQCTWLDLINKDDQEVGYVWVISEDYVISPEETIKKGTQYVCIKARTVGSENWAKFNPEGAIDLTKYAQLAQLSQVAFTGSYKSIIDLGLATNLADGLLSKEDKIIIDSLQTVATTGSYYDLKNRPTAKVVETGDYADLTGLPNLAPIATSGRYSDLTDKPGSADGMVPVGTIIMIATTLPSYQYPDGSMNIIPEGYLLCDGAAVNRTNYHDLFSAIGVSYGPGNGSTTFNLPNMIGRFPEGGANAGAVHEAGLPNITGKASSREFTAYNNQYLNHNGKALYWDNTYSQSGNEGSSDRSATLCIDASRCSTIYGNSDTVQPPSVVFLFCIKY